MQFPSCAVVPFTTPGGTGQALLTSAGVTVIESPPGTLTDRGVGDGSTVAQIESTYGNDHSTMTIQTESGESIFVTTGDPGQVGNGNPGGLIGFSIHGGTVGPPVVGGVPGFEYCSGNSSTSQLPTASTSEGCGTITYPETGVVASIDNLQGGITCEVAMDTAERYLNDTSLSHAGNTWSAEFDGWLCSVLTATASELEGHSLECADRSRGISFQAVP
ncbi:hypothetical protein [Rhodococcus sp. IEGM 1406]|uniref:hypothetical protein n=1 Tax=Rhodococcus sp. IEGM 1406 TaxID=3047083 RepID=UPI0024B6C125|nr:hypothetical protein [Rhodococcus sp. IEGM 1406]MDI9904797.1 hypothetical protein [Rhodococcus sp. IEGM 1406]